MPAADDWRRMGQEEYLPGVTLTWKHYQALRADWEHAHCVFCFHKFLDPNYSPSRADALRDSRDCSDAGYTNVGGPDRPAGEWWICAQCFADFNDEFGWRVVETDPDAWPYSTAEPTSRLPTTPAPGPRRELSNDRAKILSLLSVRSIFNSQLAARSPKRQPSLSEAWWPGAPAPGR